MLSAYLSKRFRQAKRRTGIVSLLSKASTLGVMLGVTVLIIALSVINGFEQQLEERLLSVVPHVSYQAPYEPIDNWPKKVEQLEQHPNILAATPEINLTAMVQYKGKLKATQLKAVIPRLHQKVSGIGAYIQGKNIAQLKQNEIVLGKKIAQSLGAIIGDRITILVANQHADKPLAAPKRLSLELVGIINMGGPVDESLALTHLNALQNTLGLSISQVTGLRAKVDNIFQAHDIAMNAGQSLTDLVYVNSWFRTQGSLYQDIQMVRTIVFLVVFLIIAVASFNIVSSMVMEVKEKQASIAILKTMGAKDSTIFATFALQGITYAAIGAFIGTAVGVLLAINLPDLFNAAFVEANSNPLAGVYFVEFLPSKLIWSDIIITLTVTLVLALLASVYPAWQATKTNPAQVLGNS
ncbi:Lipoprotein-releasing system transmembrane protein LolE [Pseudoalteromonas holothuriae]|uniref:Lipoprotein-releasing system transmembrane protein LolE n=1 Tax=Pseudoalteromonas holothuriae TaxID=2963714 RepID=A0ABM9GK87_9GAMM|nr:lipoprotein-releasing ABC transporter permease subunit [Pseudoalteromonas sp. CIP111951]CAH9060747.1 Lipoprotein-releasing system transmembrane protein LolE [Pseudoalteromonas sp. CIP111951]